ncbi:class I SAM-dependent methyltransferase [Oryzobacter terrae]|uniref:class I SAM-dependent methyltransferase n=1 Tax=Oryzobacter terrae TaxID=1620385 RepID=UPI00366E1208
MQRTEDGTTAGATDYDGFAAAYAAENEGGLFNAYYARPEILRLAGDVSGRRVLDAGCGSGPLTESLRDRGALVTGVDVSAAMVDLARERLGDDADLRVADLAAPLPFPDASFDDVVASLVLHYLEDWSGPLAELRRVLRPGGRLLLCVNHPAAYAIVYPEADYFAVTRYSEDYVFDGQTVWLTFWHRPLHTMADSFSAAGFRISTISEPPPAPDTPPELLPPGLEHESFMCFLFFALEAV